VSSPSWKTPLKLAGVLTILACTAVWFQYTHGKKEAREKYQENLIFPISSDSTQITAIKIKGPLGLIELQCESISEKNCNAKALGKWTLKHVAANPYAVQEFLKDARAESASKIIDLAAETPEKRKVLLNDYGLSEELRSKPEMSFIELKFVDNHGAVIPSLTVWFGQPDITGNFRYVGHSHDGKMDEQHVFFEYKRFIDKVFSQTADSFK